MSRMSSLGLQRDKLSHAVPSPASKRTEPMPFEQTQRTLADVIDKLQACPTLATPGGAT